MSFYNILILQSSFIRRNSMKVVNIIVGPDETTQNGFTSVFTINHICIFYKLWFSSLLYEKFFGASASTNFEYIFIAIEINISTKSRPYENFIKKINDWLLRQEQRVVFEELKSASGDETGIKRF